MTSVADLVRALHDVDAYRGKTCRTCFYGGMHGYCALGHHPYDLSDGCEGWRKAHRWPPSELPEAS